jgi:hypothetical protein
MSPKSEKICTICGQPLIGCQQRYCSPKCTRTAAIRKAAAWNNLHPKRRQEINHIYNTSLRAKELQKQRRSTPKGLAQRAKERQSHDYLARLKKWVKANPERVKAIKDKYIKTHPEKVVANYRKQNAGRRLARIQRQMITLNFLLQGSPSDQYINPPTRP